MVDLLESFIMSKDEFKDFLKILNFFSNECNDLHIVDGKVLQRTNDRVVAIRCDLSSLMKFDNEIIFCDIKKIVKNIKTLDKDSPIRFRRAGNTMRIQDKSISIDIPLGGNVFIDNQKISEDEFNRVLNMGPMILESEMDKKLCESLASHFKLSNNLSMAMIIQTNKVALSCKDPEKTAISREFKFNYKLIKDMWDCRINLPIAFFNQRSRGTLKIYFDANNIEAKNIVLINFTIPFNEAITFELYGRAAIITEEENDEL